MREQDSRDEDDNRVIEAYHFIETQTILWTFFRVKGLRRFGLIRARELLKLCFARFALSSPSTEERRDFSVGPFCSFKHSVFNLFLFKQRSLVTGSRWKQKTESERLWLKMFAHRRCDFAHCLVDAELQNSITPLRVMITVLISFARKHVVCHTKCW
jgi:hypothetical protein